MCAIQTICVPLIKGLTFTIISDKSFILKLEHHLQVIHNSIFRHDLYMHNMNLILVGVVCIRLGRKFDVFYDDNFICKIEC